MNYKVFIAAAGKGNKFGAINEHLNEALITVNLKPGISYIIEKFPENVPIVIALGHQGEKLKSFLELAYPKRKFEFVEIEKFDGPGAGLGHTMLKCKDQLQCPFIFCTNDTIVDENIPEPNTNWIGYTEENLDTTNYRTLKIKDNKVEEILKKGATEDVKIYIGLAGINDYSKFWKTMLEQKELSIPIGETIGLKALISENISAIKFTWHDTGNLDAIEKTRERLKQSDAPNILPKGDEAIWFIGDNVIKYHKDEDFISKRVERCNHLASFIPKVEASSKYFYVYKKVPGEIFSKRAQLNDFKYLMDWLEQFWKRKELNNEESDNFKKACTKFYKDKTIERVKKYFQVFEQIDTEEIINGERIPKVMELLDKVDWDWVCDGIASRYHGDLHFENILINENTKMPFTLLDWRQNFGGIIEYGDIYYDLGKLNHGLIICHELINKNQFNVSRKTNIIEFDFLRKQNLVECENYLRRFCIKNGYDYKKVEMMTYLIYLNIAALHHYPYSLLLFYLGKSGLYRLLNENGN